VTSPLLRNAVLASLILIAILAALATGFVSVAPNRLLSGQPLPLWRALDSATTGAFAVTAALLLGCALLPARSDPFAFILALALLLLDLHGAGTAARAVAAAAGPAARTGLGPAFWIIALCAALAMLDAVQRRGAGAGLRLLAVAAVGAGVAALVAGGDLSSLSILREYAARRDAFAAELARHCLLVLASLGAALAIGVPLGLLAARRSRLEAPLFAVLNLVQTIPSIALFGLLILPLSALRLGGVGIAPALVALTLYALLPIARNTQAAIAGIEPAVIEAADGMGFTHAQRFRRIELPLGLPVFLAGVRITLVQSIGLAVVAALIGAGGLGTFVFQGLGQYAVDLVLLGAIPTILLSLAADFLMGSAIALLRR
jgi:osmoprotectant transport system permease protein